jgi:hypothetical protein
MKHFVLAGVCESERAELTQLLSRTRSALDEAWAIHDGVAPVDFVIVDLEQFAGRVARVRAINERTAFAVLADAQAHVTDAPLVLRRPLSPEAVADAFNRAIGGPSAAARERTEAAKNTSALRSVETAADAGETDSNVTRACFSTPRTERACTDFATLLQRGPLLIERPGLPKLVLDPAGDSYHTNAPLSRLEPYFLDPLKGNECRQLARSRLDELRATAPGRPLMQLHWMGALLRSNGCLGAHLDPGGTYRVQRWMSVYGEYRKQYRIATLMMRPLRLHEIAQKANATMTEVFDVVNAYDAVGLLEWQPRASRHALAAAGTDKTAERQHAAITAQSKHRLLAAALLTR